MLPRLFRRPIIVHAFALVLAGAGLVLAPDARGHSPVGRQADADVEGGKRAYEAQCARCHGMKGTGGTGPSLDRPVLRHALDDQALLRVIMEGISGTGMPGSWWMSDRVGQQIVSYVRSFSRTAAASLSGDPEMGKLVYERSQCAGCHIVLGQGASIGPELTDIGSRRGPDFLRQAMSHPGSEMPLDSGGYMEYLVVRVVTRDGEEIRGRRVNEDTFTIQLRTIGNRYHSFRKQDLRELHREAGASLMLPFDEATPVSDLDNLVAYLASLQGES